MKDILLVLVAAILLFGCTSAPTGQGQNNATTSQGGEVKANVTTGQTGIQNGTQAGVGLNAEWCKPGAYWSTTGAAGGQINLLVSGFETYKGKQMCHATYTATGTDAANTGGITKMEYWFTQDGKEVCYSMTYPSVAQPIEGCTTT
jgi:hypothetical protein